MEIPRQTYPVIPLVLVSSQVLPPIAVSISPLVLTHVPMALIVSLPVLLVMDIREEHPPILLLATLGGDFREADTPQEQLPIPAA